MSAKSFFEGMCQDYYWLVRGHKVRITRLSRRSFRWRVYDRFDSPIGWGKASSANGAFRSAEVFILGLDIKPAIKNWLIKLWDWLRRK